MAMTVPSLDAINEAAGKNAYTIDDIPWHLGVDQTKYWGPESMGHLWYCPSYALLNDEEKLYYNQVHGTWIAEQFIFLEDLLLVVGFRSLLRRMERKIPANFKRAIEVFCEEEKKHTEMFDRLLKLANPEIYGKKRFAMQLLGRVERALLDVSMAYPEIFVWWVWKALLAEERTLDVYRKYKSAPDAERVDPLFYAVHKFHAKDEMRHFQIDHHLLELLWDPAPSWKRWFNRAVFMRVVRSFTRPRRTVALAARRLVDRFPRLEPHRAQIVQEITSVETRPEWLKAFWSRDSLPLSFACFDRYPELHALSAEMPLYTPPA